MGNVAYFLCPRFNQERQIDADMVSQVARGEEHKWWVISPQGRAKLKQLRLEIHVTYDMGRPYKCVVQRRGIYTMEDLLAFVEIFSLFLFRHGDILDPRV